MNAADPKPDASERTGLLGKRMSAAQIAEQSKGGLIASFVGKIGMHSMQFLTLIVMARLLAPADFGVLTMVMSIIGIAGIFQDLGLSAATVREPDLRHAQVNTLFWINVALGSSMTLAGCLAAPALKSFYSDPRVETVALALSCNFLITSLGSQHFALLRRNLRFRELASIGLMGTLIANLAALALAWAGAHYWALVASALISSIFATVVAWRYSGWRPTRPAFDPSARRMMSFGGYMVVFGVMRYGGANVQNVLLGRLWGSAEVGHFNRGSQMLALLQGYVVDPIDLTAKTSISKLHADTGEFRNYYLQQLTLLLALTAPIGCGCVVLGADLIRVLMGPAWENSGRVLEILGYGVIPQILSFTTGWIFVARGDSLRMMRWGIVGWGFLILGLSLGATYGMTGVAVAYVLCNWLLCVPCLVYAYAGTGLELKQVWIAAAPIAGAAAFAGVLLYGLAQLLAGLAPLARLALAGPAYVLAYAALLAMPFGQGHLLADLRRFVQRPGEVNP